MNIFNSLGSNYNFSFILKTFFSGNNQNDKEKLEQFLGNKYKGKVTLLYKGREALELGLKSLNLPHDSFVAICGFTCFAVYEAIKNAGCEVEYLDIERGELNFSVETLQTSLKKNPKIRVVVIQNTLGYPCDIEQISKVCKDYKLILIEDLAHSIGTKYANTLEAGTVGDMVVLSFSQDKIIDGVSGGALIKKDYSNIHLRSVRIKKQIIDRLYPFFTYFIRNTYPIGFGKVLHSVLKSLRLLSRPMGQLDNELHQLPNWYCNLINKLFTKLSKNIAHRRKIALIYAEAINPKFVSSKITSTINLSTNLRFPIFVNNRESLIQYLKERGIYISDIWYDTPIAPNPNAELASEEILNLPTHINVSGKVAKEISEHINQWLKLQ